MLLDFWEKGKIQKNKHVGNFNTETMLPISEIKNWSIIMKDWWLRAILKVKWVNLDLKNYDELEIILEQYKRFLNWLSFPIQILIRNNYLDLSNYLTYMEKNIKRINNKILKTQWEWYIKFLQWIQLQQWLIFVKEFYIVVPFYEMDEDKAGVRKSWFSKFMDVLNSKDSIENIVSRYRKFLKLEKFLDTRCNLIIEWLWSIWVSAKKISTYDIVRLLFNSYNPMIHFSQSELKK